VPFPLQPVYYSVFSLLSITWGRILNTASQIFPRKVKFDPGAPPGDSHRLGADDHGWWVSGFNQLWYIRNMRKSKVLITRLIPQAGLDLLQETCDDAF